MVGFGSPAALQFKVTLSSVKISSFVGGLVINFGGMTTTRCVRRAADPKMLDAEHWQVSESVLLT